MGNVLRRAIAEQEAIVTSTRDIDTAKDRLVDSLSSARDATRAAVRNDIAPAVASAVDAAREAAGPAYAEAANRAAEAVSAVRTSDAAKSLRKTSKAQAASLRKTGKSQAKALRKAAKARTKAMRKAGKSQAKAVRTSDAAKALAATGAVKAVQRRRGNDRRSRWPIVAVLLGTAAGVYAIMQRRKGTQLSDSYPAQRDAHPVAPTEAAGNDTVVSEQPKPSSNSATG